ncbi:MBL fold metallo-hydrolase [Ruminococcus sp. CLA-AA-H200]|uniref:MBL fold metallo-hydrolase n=1 Tax=Ruminococcus turbiniformis TaxID=2881258 RepID=A0ABS8FXR1_9FIRM|nr:MBL fold metallo-hydrolase [Ruminococcus turbiniformis]MCC2254128.1 MBL fold metallo-hydrolase [Ruminococcus turbiniformis]
MKKRIIACILAAGLIGSGLYQGETVNAEESAGTGTRIHIIALDGDTEAILLESDGHFGMIDSGEDTDYPDGTDPRYPLRPGTVISGGSEEQVIEYLRELGVNEDNFDFYIGTHAHSDHIGSADEIIREFSPDRVYLARYDDSLIENESGIWDNQYIYDNAVLAAYETGAVLIQQFDPDLPADSYEEMEPPQEELSSGDGMNRLPAAPYSPQEGVDLRDEGRVYSGPSISAKQGRARTVPPEEESELEEAKRSAKQGSTHLTLGSMELEIFNYNVIEELGTVWDANQMSLCVKATYNGNTAFFGGDLSADREAVIASEIGSIDLMKANHHGFYSSNSYEFVAALSPEIVVVTGANISFVSEQINKISAGSAGTDVGIYATGWYYGQVGALVFDMGDFSSNVSESPLVMAGTADSAYTLFLDGRKYTADGVVEYSGQNYYFDNSPYASVDEWNTRDGKWYYSGSDGVIQTGWLEQDGNRVYITEEFERATGWLELDDGVYYFDENGAMQTGWLELEDDRYYLDKNGRTVTGWHFIDGALYYFEEDGRIVKGEHKIDGKTFLFDEETGELLEASGTGWQQFGSIWSYFDKDGKALTDWQFINGKWYYLGTDGVMSTGWQNVDGKWYYFNGSGAMQTGWQSIGGIWYYFNGSGAMQTGWQYIGSRWYYLNESGEMLTGWQNIGGVRYYLDGSGAMATGWQLIDGIWYYFDGSGMVQTGWQYIGGRWYYLNADGEMTTGWQLIGDAWYYLSGSGAMVTGWQYIGGAWYYLSGSGAMATGWQYINGAWYYLSGSGAMTTGWQYIGGAWYYLSGSGAMVTGWQYIGGAWYYLSGSGAMATGWQNIGGYWYYLKSNGAMAASEWVDGVYYVNGSGVWIA